MDDAQLRTVWQQRQFNDRVANLGQPLAVLMKHTLARRFRQLSRLAAIWDELIPESIRDHTALDSFSGGVLTVVVDSAPHRFQLQTLLRGGLLRAIQANFSGAINKVRLVPGQFAAVDLAGDRRYEF
jgi:predicted nucleic acid-binding Zn ribbon protein